MVTVPVNQWMIGRGKGHAVVHQPATVSESSWLSRPIAAKTATTQQARRPKLVAEPTRESIAEQAYLLWERGEPGGETDHWLRAEAELRAA